MSTSENSEGQAENVHLEPEMLEHAKKLLSHLEQGNSVDAMQVISSLHFARDQFLYQEVGKLTRRLHTSIREFALDTIDPTNPKEASKMADASDRLSYVIEKTETAANRTMDLVEATIPESSALGDGARALQASWAKLRSRQMTPDQFRELSREIESFLEMASAKTSAMEQNLSNILLAQDYQDLTGQIIKKVIQLVTEVESSLVDLVKVASNVDHMVGISHEYDELTEEQLRNHQVAPEGPIVNAEKRDDVVQSQDDVDDLLSSLGF